MSLLLYEHELKNLIIGNPNGIDILYLLIVEYWTAVYSHICSLVLHYVTVSWKHAKQNAASWMELQVHELVTYEWQVMDLHFMSSRFYFLDFKPSFFQVLLLWLGAIAHTWKLFQLNL